VPGWAVERVTASPAALHDRATPVPGRRLVRLCRATGPALVIGSAQPRAHVDEARARTGAVAVVRRHSGGGAVLVDPDGPVWVDVSIPASDPLWHDDVGLAFGWLGDVWVRALSEIGVAGARAHEGAPQSSPWSSRVCFAGLGPGEVTLLDRKVVGISQRRTRDGALFQCAALLSWDPGPLVDLLALSEAEREAARADLDRVAAGLHLDGDELVDTFVSSLPRLGRSHS